MKGSLARYRLSFCHDLGLGSCSEVVPVSQQSIERLRIDSGDDVAQKHTKAEHYEIPYRDSRWRRVDERKGTELWLSWVGGNF
jgi:hypothetical protein